MSCQKEWQDGPRQQIRVLYSFPLALGADRICYTAWQQVTGLSSAGADLLVYPASQRRSVPPEVRVHSTLAVGRFRLPYKVVGTMRAVALHDRIVAHRIEKLKEVVDIIHVWNLGALETLKAAKTMGIPTVLERPNAHTGFAMEVVQKECDRLGVALPVGHEHAFNVAKLRKEETEYRLATRILCPSDFVVRTFVEKGYLPKQLAHHRYGFDELMYYPRNRVADPSHGLTMLFVGVCAVRKGLHYALEAWLQSPASNEGRFLIAGAFLPEYRERLSSMLAHPSVKVLGHRTDVPELMRNSDILVLPSIEEGFGLVITEAIGSGCVPLASDACTELCSHMETGLTHRVGDVKTLTEHITLLHQNRHLLQQLRDTCIRKAPNFTWKAAGQQLLNVYRDTIVSSRTALSGPRS